MKQIGGEIMDDKKAETMMGLSVVAITKCLMQRYSISCEKAYRKLAATDFYDRLTDAETGLYLESDAYLCDGCVLELEHGKDAMYTTHLSTRCKREDYMSRTANIGVLDLFCGAGGLSYGFESAGCYDVLLGMEHCEQHEGQVLHIQAYAQQE